MFVEVAFPLPLNRTFHYRVPSAPDPDGSLIGRRVLVPFGKKLSIGYVVGTPSDSPPFAIKPIQSYIDNESLLDETLLELARWLAQTYLCSFGEALAAILPPHLRPPKRQISNEDSLAPIDKRSLDTTQDPAIRLSAEQNDVLAHFLKAAESKAFHPFLLRGITDSGKTELYLRAMDRVLSQGRQALFLLPEIALTPPFIDRLKSRYSQEKIGLWHSGVNPGERYRTWAAARRGEIRILLGARSAVFAPFPDLGIIIMDEEHEPSYKQEDRPRYHTRDVALWRAERAGALVIMGSATPSLESYWNAKKGVYRLLELTSRVEMRQLPPVLLIDRRGNPPAAEDSKEAVQPAPPQPRVRRAHFAVFSEPLKLALEQRLARREQVILFVNRRGFTPFLRCSKCGWVARCERCSLALALHIKDLAKGAATRFQGKKEKMPVPADAVLRCHSCVRTYPVPIQCPSCKGMRLGYFGIGTQRVEQEVKELFPFVKIARLDRDIHSFRRSYEQIYRAFAGKELDVLVGTQMIAKGFDFPGVTLVGVVDADVSLHLPDFRSAERTFQLMAQVGGRTGRGDQGGKVLVQTHHPEHYALQAAVQHDYVRFYEEELQHRNALKYPPYCRLINLVIRGRKEAVVKQSAEELATELGELGAGVDLLGPAPASHNLVRGQFRYQILLKGTPETLAPYKEFLRGRRLKKAFLTVDIDPLDLL